MPIVQLSKELHDCSDNRGRPLWRSIDDGHMVTWDYKTNHQLTGRNEPGKQRTVKNDKADSVFTASSGSSIFWGT